MPYALGQRSLAQLEGVHPLLARIVHAIVDAADQDADLHLCVANSGEHIADCLSQPCEVRLRTLPEFKAA